MIKRRIINQIEYSLARTPAVTLLGPRQVGKTTLALEVAKKHSSIYLDLELESDKAKLSDPESYLNEHKDKLVILDEVQRHPNLFQNLRALIDQGRRSKKKNGRFLLLGSASIELLKQSGESLAGRISYKELAPVDILEAGSARINKLWLRGGFPDSLLSANDTDSLHWRLDFIRTYLERDIPQLGPRIPAETLRRFWIMLAHNQGQLLNAAKLANNLAVDGKTVARYLDLLVDLLLVRRLQPWHGNVGKRLVKSPKTYIRDSGITHALLNIQDKEDLLSHPIVGMSWEGFIIENILNVLPPNTEASFYRSAAGAEIDLVLTLPKQKIWAIEIKRTTAPKMSKGFRIAIEDINANKSFIVYSGKERFPLGKNSEAIGLHDIMQLVADI